ncbi:MAG: S8 family serine peptidase [Anaerolineales bacterium]|nr:S8 family serine peptidase [Anaerolineales bacterium]
MPRLSLRKITTLIILASFFFAPSRNVTAAFADRDLILKGGNFVEDEILVRFDPTVPPDRIQRLLREANADIMFEINMLGVRVLKVPRGDVETVILKLRRRPEILFAEPNYYIYADDTYPNDPNYQTQYGLTNIRAPQGWDLSTGASWVTIAVIDTGVDLLHPDLMYKTIAGYDFVNNDTIPQDDNGHGTHVAGIAAAMSNNGEGIAGVSWGANIMPLKVLDGSGNGTYANVAAAIIWATDHGAQVINMSLGGLYPSATLEDAVIYAYTHGMVQVAAAGNSGSGSVLYPAKYAPVIAVAATDNFNTRAGFSNYGPEVDLAAPGVNILSLYPGGGYGYRSGTSMAAPFVSGLAAILIGLPNNYDAGLVEMQMESTALDLGTPGWDTFYGAGLIQMDRAIVLAIPPSPTPSSTPTSTAIFTLTPTATASLTSPAAYTSTPTPTAIFTLASTTTASLTSPAAYTSTPTPTFHLLPPKGTKTPPPGPWSWFPRPGPSPTSTLTPPPFVTPSPITGSVPLTISQSTEVTTVMPTLIPEADGDRAPISWSLCLGTFFTLVGIFLLIYSRPSRKYRRKKNSY